MCGKPAQVFCTRKQLNGTCGLLIGEQEAKADAGKLHLHLVPMQIVRDICEVREYGNRKYGDPNNWRQVELMRYVDALLRHTLAFAEDIHSVDEESGIPHYKHMECNLAFISELMRLDRPAMTGEDPLLRDIFRECEDHDRAGGKTAASAGD